MTGITGLLSQGDAVTRLVAAVLLAMSVLSWILIGWKAWTLARARRDLACAVPAFWNAGDLATAGRQLGALDRERLLAPLLAAATRTVSPGTLESAGQAQSQLTRRLRDALHRVVERLQFGHVALASIGSTAPFVGLFGTVWGIYHALAGIAASGSITVDRVAGPVGEALVMTAAGLAVAIPAVLAYNVFSRWVGTCEADLEGFAHDLREVLLDGAPGAGAAVGRLPVAGEA